MSDHLLFAFVQLNLRNEFIVKVLRSLFLSPTRYHKCPEKATVQTFQISDKEHSKDSHDLGISAVLLTGLKYLLGGFAILALPFIVLKVNIFNFSVLKTFFESLDLFQFAGVVSSSENFLVFESFHVNQIVLPAIAVYTISETEPKNRSKQREQQLLRHSWKAQGQASNDQGHSEQRRLPRRRR